MDDRKPEYFFPALVGGALSGALLVTPFVNLCCCLWLIPGGMLAAWLLSTRTGPGLKPGDGAVVGALTGIVAAVVDTLLNFTPLREINLRVLRTLADRFAEFSGATQQQM
ncbi:MAG TPA: hypothetical protein VE082_05480, partial [Desulfobaccales bacterium]|nr:hypothetical protein [Desulfobaccales bacterium]